jgi:peptide chain release factor 2
MASEPKTKEDIETRIREIEGLTYEADFWADSQKAQKLIEEMNDLKAELEGGGKYDKLPAILSIVAGAGGDDAEDFAAMLFTMYRKYAESRGWGMTLLHENQNDHGGYRNLSVEIDAKGAYGTLRGETGVHRLVRISPFNAKQQRHTSFVLVDVVPKLGKVAEIEINPDDLDIQFARSSGAGGQNVNKRETAVRIVHRPTNIAVHCEFERSQERNRERAMEMLMGKLVQLREEERRRELQGLAPRTGEIEWGSQIRSYVLHPYKMIKDHRTEVERHDAEKILENGDIQEFLDAEKNLDPTGSA